MRPTAVRAVSSWILTLGAVATAAAQESPRAPADWHASGRKGAVVAGGQGSVDAGMAILRAGGNAADAAAATLLALTVTDSKSVCFGGEVPILVYDAKTGSVEVIAGQGAAPALATRAHFAARPDGIPATGLEPAAVPGLLDACLVTLERHGTITFAQAVAPTLALLDAGKEPWHADLARTLRTLVEAESAAPADRRRGLRLAADAFYRGPVARAIDAFSRANGGLIRYEDMARHVTRVEEPVRAAYRGHTIVKCGPWTQGPALLETLQILDGLDLRAMGHNSAEAIHAQVEALKLGFADRDVFYADPLFVDVPMDALLAPAYAAARRGLLDPKAASKAQRPGDPRRGRPLLPEAEVKVGLGGPSVDTTTCVVADGAGNIVAATPSGWSGVVAGETGVWLGTRLQSFNTWEGHPNCIEPGKRPRITLTPTLVLDAEGKPVLGISIAGGDAQDQATLQLVCNHLDFGLSPAESVTAPRWLTDHFVGSFRQKPPELGSLQVDSVIAEPVRDALLAKGHALTLGKSPMGANPTALAIDPATGELHAAGCPRSRRHAAAY